MIPATLLGKQILQYKRVEQLEGLSIYSSQASSLSAVSQCALILQLKKGDCARQQEKSFSRISVCVLFQRVKDIFTCHYINAF